MTFWQAQERARAAEGKVILRIEDLDCSRCRLEFADAIVEDLHWLGLNWDEGPDIGGRFAPYVQSERRHHYLQALEKLRATGFIYPCVCSRKDVLQAAGAPHDEGDEPIYPGTCRRPNFGNAADSGVVAGAVLGGSREAGGTFLPLKTAAATVAHWRFRVPEGEKLSFTDKRLGIQMAIAGQDFGDFIVWRRDDVPAYQLAVVVDDAAMHVTEVVRGEDLRVSTFRQLFLYRALDLPPPRFFHAPLLGDDAGRRFAKRDQSLSLRDLRPRLQTGATTQTLRSGSKGRRRASRSQRPSHASMAKIIGKKNGSPAWTCVATAPPRYPVSSTAPSVAVCGMA
jgi:glutamyl-tRNA synthetase